jgi:hypothetical protein
MRALVSLLGGLTLAFWTQFQPALSEQSKAISPSEAVSRIREAKIIDPGSHLQVALTGKEEATVIVQRNPKAADEDCKIDAILIARTLMGIYPSQLVRVKSIFTKAGYDSDQATITAGDIKSFQSGQLDKKSLLDSIELVKVSTLVPFASTKSPPEALPSETRRAVNVAPGPYRAWRLLTLEHISKLATVGVNVKVFLDQFNDIEKLIGTPQQRNMKGSLSQITSELEDQDELTRQAQKGSGGASANGQRKRPMVAVNAKLRDLASQGKDISNYTEQVKEIRQLRIAGRDQEANRMVKELSRALGI